MTKREYETIDVTYESVGMQTLQEPDQEGKRWSTHVVCLGDGRMAKAVGSMFQENTIAGLEMTLSGYWDRHKQYGKQFKFETYAVKHPNGMEGTVAFLCQASGIGHTIAQRIWNACGETSIESIISTPKEICKQVKGLNEMVAVAASEYLSDIYLSSKKMLPVITLLSGVGINRKAVSRFVGENHVDHVALLMENPFYLDKFSGVGFLKCDELRKKLDLPSDGEYRYVSAVKYCMRQESSAWVHKSNVANSISEVLTVEKRKALEIVGICTQNKTLVRIGKYISLPWNARVERELYTKLTKMTRYQADWPDPFKIKSMEKATDHQKEQLNLAFEGGRAAFLLGSPGVGKTYVAAFLLKHYGPDAIACTPTNKAANRLRSCMKAMGVSAYVTTIHKALRAGMDGKGDWEFQARSLGIVYSPKLIIVDETSMVSDDLMLELLECAPKNCQFLFIGDPDQLPPVGVGCLLSKWRDMEKKSGMIKIGKLSEILRNSGDIVETCSEIRKGSQPSFVKFIHPLTTMVPNLQLVESRDEDKLFDRLKSFTDRIVGGDIKIYGQPVHPIDDVQFICAVNEKSPVSRVELNKMLQQKMNPKGGGKHKYYREGDKIICLENTTLMVDDGTSLRDIDKDVYDHSEKAPVSNGEIGRVIEAGKRYLSVRMQGDDDHMLISDTEGGRGKFDLGYAITGHKSQGSEWPIAVIVVGSDYRASMVMSREWVYTCISRAREACVIFGSEKVISSSLSKRVTKMRLTFAKKWVEEAYETAEENCPALDGDS